MYNFEEIDSLSFIMIVKQKSTMLYVQQRNQQQFVYLTCSLFQVCRVPDFLERQFGSQNLSGDAHGSSAQLSQETDGALMASFQRQLCQQPVVGRDECLQPEITRDRGIRRSDCSTSLLMSLDPSTEGCQVKSLAEYRPFTLYIQDLISEGKICCAARCKMAN